MIESRDIAARAERLERLLADRLGLRRGGLAQRAARAGRRLPAKVRRDLRAVADAATLSGHPRLARGLDGGRIAAAAERAEAYLAGIDPADRLRGRLLGLAGVLGANLIVLTALVVIVLRWRGLI